MNGNRSRPLGPANTYKTGQRCPRRGRWMDQRGNICFFEAHSTFPPVPGRRFGGGCAYWKLLLADEATA